MASLVRGRRKKKKASGGKKRKKRKELMVAPNPLREPKKMKRKEKGRERKRKERKERPFNNWSNINKEAERAKEKR